MKDSGCTPRLNAIKSIVITVASHLPVITAYDCSYRPIPRSRHTCARASSRWGRLQHHGLRRAGQYHRRRRAHHPRVRFKLGPTGLDFSTFLLRYTALNMPSGAWADRWGPRRILTAAGLSWFTLTILTARRPGRVFSSLGSVFGILLVLGLSLGSL